MGFFKQIHLASKDISNVFNQEMFLPKLIAYPIWYFILLIVYMTKSIKSFITFIFLRNNNK
jgi:flagellar biosynthesis protein FliQ